VDSGGFNHISNRVPACPRCNEHEKRDMDWQQFLQQKSGSDEAVRARRQAKIEEWMHLRKCADFPVTAEQRAAWKHETDALAEAIDTAWKRLKATKKG
jgi:hypothetical protein